MLSHSMPMEVQKSPRKVVASRKVEDNSVVDLDEFDEFEFKPEREKAYGSQKKKKRKVVDFEPDEEDSKPLIFKSTRFLAGNNGSQTEGEEEEDKMPISRLKKRRRSTQETDSDGDGLSDGKLGFETPGDDEAEAIKDEEDTGDGGLAVSQDEDMLLTQLSAFQTQETDDGDPLETQERRVKPRAASSLPIVFAEKVIKTKVLLECEGDAVDLSGDMGAVGRFTVGRDDDLSLDLKGIIYKTTIVPSNTFFVVNVGQTEAKVECIMSDFVQLRADTNCNENETMVEGTLKDFGFDSDEEREHLAVDGGEKADASEKTKPEEGANDNNDSEQAKKKKEKAAKASKIGKVPAKKAVAGKSKVGRGVASAKGVGKKHAAKATKPKASKQ